MADTPSNTAGAQEAFLAAYDEYADNLFRFILVKVSDRERAQDLVQETFTRAWDSIGRGTEVKQWKPFLFRIAYNLIVDSYRANAKRGVSLEALAEENGFDPHDEQLPAPDTKAELSLVRQAIDELPETHRELVLLRYVEGLTPKDIAEMTGLTQNVVSVRIHRGMHLLREKLDPREPRHTV